MSAPNAVAPGRGGDLGAGRQADGTPRGYGPSGGTVKPGEALRLFEALYGPDLPPGWTVEIRPLAPGGKPDIRRRAFCGSLADACAAARRACDAGRDVFYGLHPRRRGAASGQAGDVAALVAVPVDVDATKHGLDRTRVLAALSELPWGDPSAVVWSGGGVHGYAFLREPLDPGDEEERRAYGLACAAFRYHVEQRVGVASTDTIDDLPRILRVPGTLNRKADYPEPRPVRLLACDPDRRFDVSDLAEWAPSDAWAGCQPLGEAAPAPLPAEVAKPVRRVLEATGWIHRVKRSGPGVAAVLLRDCPAASSHRAYPDEERPWTAHVTPERGRLRCKRGSCDLGPNKPSDGLRLVEWVPRYARGTMPALLAALGETGR